MIPGTTLSKMINGFMYQRTLGCGVLKSLEPH
jgi:hypothetical protein